MFSTLPKNIELLFISHSLNLFEEQIQLLFNDEKIFKSELSELPKAQNLISN